MTMLIQSQSNRGNVALTTCAYQEPVMDAGCGSVA